MIGRRGTWRTLGPSLALSLVVVAGGLACSSGHDVPVPAGGGGSLSVVAGAPSGMGSVDGPLAAARFFGSVGLVVTGDGDLVVADTLNNTIRKVTPGGMVSTLAGASGVAGYMDGRGASARFNAPYGLALDKAGNIYVTEAMNHTLRKITPDGTVSTLAGAAGQAGSADGSGGGARFNFPEGLAVDAGGNLLVADSGNSTIRKVTPDGTVTTLAGTAGQFGSDDGIGGTARFSGPDGLAIDPSGNLLVADAWNGTLRKVAPNGTVTTLAGSPGNPGGADGMGAAAQFSTPMGIAVDPSGNAFVVDAGGRTIRKVTPDGQVSTFAGNATQGGCLDGSGAGARFAGSSLTSSYLASDSSGNLYMTDNGGVIRKVTSAGTVTTLGGAPRRRGCADGAASTARFDWPNGVAVDASGNLFVADQDNGLIRKIGQDGSVSTFAGTPGAWNTQDGTGASAQFNGPGGLALDAAGNLYVSEFDSHTIRKVSPSGVVTTLAGMAGQPGSADGPGAQAQFDYPNDVAVDAAGNVFVADYGNHTIRKISSAGMVTTLAGSAGVAGYADGVGSSARFNLPAGIAVDKAGNLYVTEFGNQTVRKITQAGVVTTLAGSSGQAGSEDGTGSLARFNQPWCLKVGPSGDLFVADSGNNRIRRVSPDGTVTTVAGNPQSAFNEPGPLPGGIFRPVGLAVNPATGALYTTVLDAVLKISLP